MTVEPAPKPSTMLDAALSYIGKGWAVFPLHTPLPNGKCDCRHADCNNEGKHPRIAGGLLNASNNEDQIRKWWKQWPTANIGVACGPSGIVAIDIDPRHGGDDSYRDLVATHGRSLLDTISSNTGGGGEHYIFTAPAMPLGNVTNSPKYTGPLGHGVDVRANGGYIVAPPSLHVSGGVYEWYTGEGLFDREPSPLPFPLFDLLATKTEKPSDEREKVSVAEHLQGIDHGARDWELYRLASALRRVDVPREWAYRLVEEAAANCRPALSAEYAQKKVDSAYDRHAPSKDGLAMPNPDLVNDEGRVLLWPLISAALPPIDFLIEDAIVAGMVHLFHGEPGCGKTILALAFSLDMVRRGKPVMFIDEESGIAMVARRLSEMGVDPSLDTYFYYYPFLGITLTDADALMTRIEEVQPALIVFDSMADVLSASGLDENASVDVTKWMMQIAVRAAREHNCAVIILDHNTKDAANTKYARGSGAKKAKTDVSWYVEKKIDFDANKLGRVRLSCTKNRIGVLIDSITYVVGGQNGQLICERFDPSRHEAVNTPPAEKKVIKALLDAHPEKLSNKQIQDKTSYGHTRVHDVIKPLKERGVLYQDGYGSAITYGIKDIETVQWMVGDRPVDDSRPSDPIIRSAPLYRGDRMVDGRVDSPEDDEEEDDDPIGV